MIEANRAWKSLSGYPLVGHNLAKIAFVDETGVANPKHEPFLVVAGVIVDADKQLTHLERRIERLADRIVPPAHRAGFFFHAKDLFAGVGPVFGRKAGYFTLAERMKVAEQMAAIVAQLKLPVVWGAAKRSEWDQIDERLFREGKDGLGKDRQITQADKNRIQHTLAFLTAAVDLERWMRKNASSEIAWIVAENAPETEANIRRVQNLLRDPSLAQEVDEHARGYLPFRRIKASPLFERKQDSVALQIADYCAYVIKRMLMEDKHIVPYYAVLLDHMVKGTID